MHFKPIQVALAAIVVVFLALAEQAWAKPTPDNFGQRVSVFDAAISPDGTQLGLVQNINGDYIVRVMNLEKLDDEPRAIGLGKGVKPKYVKWVNDDRLVVSIWQNQKRRTSVFRTSFLYTLDTKTMDGKLLVKPRGFRQFNDRVLDWLEDDPDHIMMQFADDGADQSYPSVLRVNVETGRRTVVKRQSNDINTWLTDSSGEPRLGVGTRKDGATSFILVRVPGTDRWDTSNDYPGLDPDNQYFLAVMDAGRSLIVSAYRGKDKRGLHRYDLLEKRFTETIFENADYDVTNLILSKDGEDIVGASYTGEAEERVLFDEYDSTFEEALAELDGFQVDFIDQNADSTQLLLRVSSPSNPGGMYLYTRGEGLSLIANDMPGLSANEMGEVLALRYTARDGTKIPAYVTLPTGLQAGQSPENMPFIVLPHGGPYARDEKRFDYFAQFFAAQGYGVLQMNFRGSEGYGKSFADAGRNNWVVMQEDVEDGMRWLLDKGYADPEKSCIAGWSYGGYAALMGAAKDPELYNCVVAIAALTDIPGAVKDLRSYVNGKEMAKRTFGPILDDRDLLKANNPVDVADQITVPVFMAHGTKDTSVEIDQFKLMKKRLERAGVDGTYLQFEDEDHYMSDQENRQAMLNGIAKFLRKTNGKSPFAG